MVSVIMHFGIGSVLIAGVTGGVLFLVFEMAAAGVLMGFDGMFVPLRMMAAMLLGRAALDPSLDLFVAAPTGLLIHGVLSMLFALLFVAMVSPRWTTQALALAGIAYGTALWLLNFHLIAPLMGWAWFANQTNPIVQFIAHAFFYGCPVGWYLGRSRLAVVRPLS